MKTFFLQAFSRRRRNRTQTLVAQPLELRLLLSASGVPDIAASLGTNTISEQSGFDSTSLTVSLTAQPTASVVVAVHSENPDDVAVSVSTLTFTPEDWDQPISLLISAIDDSILEGSETANISVSIVPELSAVEFADVPATDLQLNVLDYEDDITVVGTDGDDRFVFTAGDGSHSIELNDQVFEFLGQNPEVWYDGASGQDEVVIHGRAEFDKVSVSPGSIINYGTGYKVTAVRSEHIEVFSGGGGDVAYMAGSSRDDLFVADPEMAELSSDMFSNTMHGFRRVFAKASPGFDKAVLHDSPGVDTYKARPELAYLAGSDYFNLTLGFEETTAISAAGAGDLAAFHDSSESDTLTIRPEESTITGPGFSHRAVGFRGVSAYSNHGGNDHATIYDSVNDDRFVSGPKFAYITNEYQYYGFAKGFAEIEVFASGGFDEAQFYESGPDDWSIQSSGYALHLKDATFMRQANGFDKVRDFVDQSAATPYEDAIPVYDVELHALDLANRTGVAYPNDYRFSYVHALDALSEQPEVQEQGESIMSQLPSYLENHSDGVLFEMAEYHELIAPEGTIESVSTDAAGIETLTLTDRFGLESRVLRLLPGVPSKGQVILLHGSYSLPEYLTGQLALDGTEYHHVPALTWQAAGYEVLIPEMQGSSYRSLDVLGYGFVGLESARVIDLITSLPASDGPLVVAGISRGAAIAETVAALTDDVDAVVSSGGAMRRPIGSGKILGYPEFLSLLSDKILVVSAATRDTHVGWTFYDLQQYRHVLQSDFYANGGAVTFNYFVGYHEMDAVGEIAALESLLFA